MFKNENVENLLGLKEVEQPKNLEEANVIIESLKRDFNNLKRISKRVFLLFGSITVILTAGEKLKDGSEKNLFNQELQNLKTNLEYASINFGQSKLEDGNIKKIEGKTAPNVIEFTEVFEKKKQNAADYLSKAERSCP